jgi:hypothetical protein
VGDSRGKKSAGEDLASDWKTFKCAVGKRIVKNS